MRLIVLYSRCRVNRSTNLSVVLYYVIFLLPLCTVWASECGVPNLWGASPLWLRPLHNSNVEVVACKTSKINTVFTVAVVALVPKYIYG